MNRINHVLVHYLLVFLLFAFFLLLLFIPVYQYVSDFTAKNELAYMENRIRGGIAAIDASVTALNNVLIPAGQDRRYRELLYSPFRADTTPFIMAELRDSLNRMLLSHKLVADAGILFPADMVVTRNRVFYAPNQYSFYGQFLNSGDLSFDEWRDLLAGGKPFVPVLSYTTPDYGSYNAVTFAVPWLRSAVPNGGRGGGGNTLIILYAALPVDGVISAVADNDVATGGRIRLYDSRDNLLFEAGNSGSPETGIKEHILTGESAAGSFRFELAVPDLLIKEKMRPIRNVYTSFAFGTAVFTVLLILLFALQSSKPTRRLLERIDAANHMIEQETQLLQSQMVDKIYSALRNANETMALNVLAECTASLPRPEDPLIAGLISNMLFSMITRLKRENPEILSGINDSTYTPGKQEELFGEYFPDCFRRICGEFIKYRETNLAPFGRQIMDYINDHLYDPELYITMVSRHFNISPPTIQKQVKNMAGQTFQNYVEHSRLARAQEMLKNGACTVRETAERCGFSTINAFYRAFKRNYGFPPSELQNEKYRLVK